MIAALYCNISKITLTLLLLLFSELCYAQTVSCKESNTYSYLLFDATNHKILSEKRAEMQIFPASLTKVMTIYMALEAIKKGEAKIDDEIVFSEAAAEIGKLNATLTLKPKVGDKITLIDAIKALIVVSSNEAATAIAEYFAESEWQFARKMNNKAKELQMFNSNFKNASGLPDIGQYSTNYDLFKLASAIVKNFPQYYDLFAIKEFSYRGQKFKSHNNILLQYPKAEGMKTGFTKMSGYNLIASAKRDDVRMISILTHCPSAKGRDLFTQELLDLAFKIQEKNK